MSFRDLLTIGEPHYNAVKNHRAEWTYSHEMITLGAGVNMHAPPMQLRGEGGFRAYRQIGTRGHPRPPTPKTTAQELFFLQHVRSSAASALGAQKTQGCGQQPDVLVLVPECVRQQVQWMTSLATHLGSNPMLQCALVAAIGGTETELWVATVAGMAMLLEIHVEPGVCSLGSAVLAHAMLEESWGCAIAMLYAVWAAQCPAFPIPCKAGGLPDTDTKRQMPPQPFGRHTTPERSSRTSEDGEPRQERTPSRGRDRETRHGAGL